MPLLFSYGTLANVAVQRSLFGRVVVCRTDALLGFEKSRARVADPEFACITGSAEHWILNRSERADEAVDGVTLELTEAELRRTDDYEPVEYCRVLAPLRSGGRAFVYVNAKLAGPVL